MPLTPDEVRSRADAYLVAINSRDPDEIAGIFAPEATFEDPVGQPMHQGRDQIRAVFQKAATTLRDMTLRRISPISVASNYAAFALQATIELAGVVSDIDVVDLLAFDDAGLVCSMRAFWNFDDVRPRG